MESEQERLFGKAWQDWRGSLTRDDLEGDPRELVYAAFQAAWLAGHATAQARITSLERQLHATAEGQRATLDQLVRVTGERDVLAAALKAERRWTHSKPFEHKVCACGHTPYIHEGGGSGRCSAAIKSGLEDCPCLVFDPPPAAASIESQGDEGREVGFPCNRCGGQIERDEHMILSECGEAHQFRTHERCVLDVQRECPSCNAIWPLDEHQQPERAGEGE